MLRTVHTEYPIEESVGESYECFLILYNLTMKANEVELNARPNIRLLEVWWARIADIWENETYLKHGVRIFDEALYHIRHKVFSSKLDDPLLLKLVLLVEDELGKCGFAFNVWNKHPAFRRALSRTLYPKRGDLTWNDFHSWWYSAYLEGLLMKFLSLKNKESEKWHGTMCCGEERIHECDRERYCNNIECFETAIKFLLPEAVDWYEEWRNAGYILNCLKQKFGMNFSSDSKGFDYLINLVLHRTSVKYSAYCLYRMKAMSPTLAQHIWGDDADDIIMRCFTDIYQRDKRAKKNKVRSGYSQKALMESWLYKQIVDWYENQPQKLTDKVRKAYFNIALGIR